jgi:hypothetical protein
VLLIFLSPQFNSKVGKAGTRTQSQAREAKSITDNHLAKSVMLSFCPIFTAHFLPFAFPSSALSIKQGTTLCYTDGASKGNPGFAGCGAYIEFGDGRPARKDHRAMAKKESNNYAEVSFSLLVFSPSFLLNQRSFLSCFLLLLFRSSLVWIWLSMC